jgi:hypothetical protein
VKVPTLTRARLVLAVAVLIAIGSAASLSWAFTEQIALSRQLRAEELRWEQALRDAQRRHEVLLELEKRVRTDAFVEDWARERLVWVREGETTVVYVDPLPAVDMPEHEVAAPVTVEEKPLWIEIWELVTGG